MKVSGISAHNYQSNNRQVQNTKHQPPAFQASLSQNVLEVAASEAASRGLVSQLKNFCKQLESWGHPKSVINKFESMKSQSYSLGLDNPTITKLYGGSMDEVVKPSLLDTLLGLKEKNILQGEQDLQDIIKSRRDGVLKKALVDDYVYNEAMRLGRKDTLMASVNNVPDDDLIRLYFQGNKIDPEKYKAVLNDLVGYLAKKDPQVFDANLKNYLLNSDLLD